MLNGSVRTKLQLPRPPHTREKVAVKSGQQKNCASESENRAAPMHALSRTHWMRTYHPMADMFPTPPCWFWFWFWFCC